MLLPFCVDSARALIEKQKHSLTGQVSGVERRRSSGSKAECMRAGQSLNTPAFKRCLFNLCFPACISLLGCLTAAAQPERTDSLICSRDPQHHHHHHPACQSGFSCDVVPAPLLCSTAVTGMKLRNAAQWLILRPPARRVRRSHLLHLMAALNVLMVIRLPL